jgi:outer membrane autotransporter protein
MLIPAAAHAGSLILAGDYIKIGLNDQGTLGYGGNTSPGILYDGTGTGTFNTAYDYLTPGSPFEGFVVSGSNGSAFSHSNNNSDGASISGSLVDYSGIAYDGATYANRAVWTGTLGGILTISNDYFFDTNSQKVSIRTTISALTDLTDLAFSRQIDPDAQAASGDSSATTNVRGAGSVSANDLVYAEALVSKYVIGLHTSSTVTHNSAVTDWTSDTASYLAGTNIGDGDNTIGLGFDIGSLLNGQNIVLDYSYIFGTNIAGAIGGPNNITGISTIEELLAGDVNPVIDGGTLLVSLAGTFSNDLTLEAGGGTIDTQSNDVTMSGVFSGAGGLTKTGTGTLTLSGANSYTGGTTVSDGRLVGDTVSLQGDIANEATVEFAQANDGAYAGLVSGTGTLVKTGTGTLTLTGANSYTGGTTVSDGRLVGDSVSLQGNIANNATVEFAQANDGSYSGTVSGTGTLVKTGPGTLSLTGANSYTGDTDLRDGTLVAGTSGAIGTGTLKVGDATFKAGGNLSLANAVVLTDVSSAVDTSGFDVALTGNLSGAGILTKLGAGTLTLTGTNSQNGIVVAGGVLAFDSDAALGAAGSVVTILEDTTLRTLADFTINHEIFVNDTQRAKFDSNGHNIVLAGDISGSGNIEKIGVGTLILTGSNPNVTINVLGGRVIATSQNAIGGGGGDITLHENGGFTAGSDMVVSQALHVVGSNATFDTGAHDVTLTGSADGNACLIKVGTGRLNLMALSSNSIGACVEQGNLSFNNVFLGNVMVEQNGTASGSGAIVGDVTVNGTLAPGNSPGQLIVAGSVTQAPGSTLAIDVDGTTPGTGAGHYDTLILTGTAGVYTAGGTITPILRGITGSATNSFTPEIGQQFQVVTAEGGVVGSFDALSQPAAGLAANTRFDVVYRPNAVILAVTPNSYAAFASRGNAVSAGQALDALRGPAGVRNISEAGTLLTGLAGLNSGRLAFALEQLSGSVHADAIEASTQALRSTRGAVSRHLDGPISTGTSLWSAINRDQVRVKADGAGQGYRAETYNLLLGIDTHATSNLTLGAAFGYSMSEVSTAGLGETDDKHYQAVAYGNWASQGTYLRGILSFGLDDYKISREVSLFDGARALNSRSDGFSYSVDLEAGHRLDLGKIAFTPFVGVAHDGVERENFAESGDTAVALSFSGDHRNAWQVRGGANVSTSFAAGNKTILTPYAHAAVTREIADVTTRINPTLNGAALTVDAASFGKTGVQGGAGIEALFSEKVSLSLGYRYKDTANAHQHSVNLGVSLRW